MDVTATERGHVRGRYQEMRAPTEPGETCYNKNAQTFCQVGQIVLNNRTCRPPSAECNGLSDKQFFLELTILKAWTVTLFAPSAPPEMSALEPGHTDSVKTRSGFVVYVARIRSCTTEKTGSH